MLLQISLTLLLALILVESAPPPGYQNKPDITEKHENNPPKYNYGYKIGDEYGSQEKQEQRDGIYALGRYYVHGQGARQTVEYLADDWGFHPFIEYSNVGPHSKSMTQIAFGEEAVRALHNGKNSNISSKLQVEQNLMKYNIEKQKEKSPNTYKEQIQLQLQPDSQDESKYKDEIIIHHPKPSTDSQKKEGSQEQQQLISANNIQQDTPNVFYGAPQYPNQQPQQQQQENIVYVPAQNYIISTQPNLQHQPLQQQYTNYQNMFLVQVNDHLGQQSFQLVPQNTLYEQHGQQPISAPPAYQQNPNENQNTLLLQNILQNVETQLNAEQSASQQTNGINKGFKTIKDYSQSQQIEQVTSKYFDNNRVEIQTNNEENTYPQPGSYGTKINAKLIVQNNISQKSKSEHGTASKLIAHTKDLVTGQDVLNINQVLNDQEDTSPVESSTAQSIIQQYSTQHTIQKNNPEVDVSHLGSDSNTLSTTASNRYTTILAYTPTSERISFVSTDTPNKEISLAKDPIVVEDFDENKLGLRSKEYDDDKEYFSTTQNTVETAKSVTGFDLTQSTVLVTPRPLGENFLAPINAGVQLQSIDDSPNDKHIMKIAHNIRKENAGRDRVVVEVQKSIPFYLGKFEFIQSVKENIANDQKFKEEDHTYTKNETEPHTQTEQEINVQKALIDSSGNIVSAPQPLIRNLPEENYGGEDNRVNENIQSISYAQIENNKDQKPSQIYYEIQSPYQQLILPQFNQLQNFEQIKQYQHIQNEPVLLKLNEEVKNKDATKYIDKPYPVQIKLPHPVPYPQLINQRYPIEVNPTNPINIEQTFENKIPIPIEVQVPVAQPYILEVPKPYPVEVTKLVPQPYPVPVTQTIKIPVPTPVEVKVPHPVAVEVPKYIDRPYPIYISNAQQFKHNPYQYAPNYQKPMKLHYEYKSQTGDKHHNDGKLQINGAKLQINTGKQEVKNFGYLPVTSSFYHTIHLNDYIGLKPPKVTNFRQPNSPTKPQGNLYTLPRKHRNARHSFDSNIRLEYGFMPPLIPSLEIDENGKPIEKSDSK